MLIHLLYTKLKEFALTHRKEPTIAENILWDKLRSKKEGYKFQKTTYHRSFHCGFRMSEKRSCH